MEDGLIKTSCLLFSLAAFVLTLFPLVAQGKDSSTEELERKLRERDKVILELLERVEALEQRVGIERGAAEASETPVEPLEQVAAPSTESMPAENPVDEPGLVVVERRDTERALERSLTRAGALLLSPGVLEVEPSLRYARVEHSTPRLFLSDDQFLAGEIDFNENSLTADVGMRLGLPWDSQLEIGLPYRWREVESVNIVGITPVYSSSQSGEALGDLRIGLAKTLFREGLWRPDLVGRITWNTDSGELQDNGVPLGGGFNELRGSLTAIKRQDPLALVGALSYEYTFEEGEIQPGSIISANFGSFIALSPETSLSFLFSGAYQYESEISGNEIVGSDRTIAAFVVGGSTLLAPGLLLNLSVDIGLTGDSDDFGITLSLPYRFDGLLY